MNPDFIRRLGEATRSTRIGHLHEATRTIQTALGGVGTVHGRTPTASRLFPDFDWQALLDRGTARKAPGAHPSMINGSFVNEAGSRDYRLFVPEGPASAPMPLIVMLHGCTQTPDDIATGTRWNSAASIHRFCVLYPAQAISANSRRCWNWYDTAHQGTFAGEPSILAGMTRRICADHWIDPRRVHVAGMSSGGAMAAVLATTHPELFESVGVHSGLAAGSANDLPSALQAMRSAPRGARTDVARGRRPPRMIVFHGANDAIVSRANADSLVDDWLERHGADPIETRLQRTTEVSPGSHGKRAHQQTAWRDAAGRSRLERWIVEGSGHAWCGGDAAGSHTDPTGPDATAEMLRFFLADLEAASSPTAAEAPALKRQ